jgi:WD40 repeat protein
LRAEAASEIERDRASAAEAQAGLQRDAAVRARQDAVSAAHEATVAQAQALKERDRSTWQSLARESLRLSSRHDHQLAALLARQAYLIHTRTPGQPRSLVEEALQKAAQLTPRSRRLSGHEGIVTSVAFSPDSLRVVSGSEDRTARVWDLNDPNAPPLVIGGHSGTVNDVAFSPDGTRLLSVSLDRKVRIWNFQVPDTPPLQTTSAKPGNVSAGAFSPDGTRVVFGDFSGVWLWDLREPGSTPSFLPTRKLAPNAVLPAVSVAFSPAGTHVAAGDLFGGVWVWDLGAPQQPQLLGTHPSKARVNSVAFSPDGTRLASAGSAKEDAWGPERGRGFGPGTDQSPDWPIRIWDLANPSRPPLMLTGQESQAHALAFSPDGRRLASAGGDGGLRVWDISQPRLPPLKLHAHELGARSVAFSPDGARLATGGADYSVRIWDLRESGMPVQLAPVHDQRVDSLAISPNNEYLASGSADNTVRIWNLRHLEAPPVRLQHEEVVRSLAFSPDGARLATANPLAWRVWNMGDLGRESQFVQDRHGVHFIAFSQDGAALASTTLSNPLIQQELNKRGANLVLTEVPAIKRWNLGATPPPASVVVQNGRMTSEIVALAEDWGHFASASQDSSILVWDLSRRRPDPLRLSGHRGLVHGIGFSRQGDLLASAGGDLAVRVWDLKRPDTPRLVFQGSGFFVTFSMDDTRLVAGGMGAADVRLWDLREASSPPLIFRPGNAELRSVAVSRDGSLMAIGDMDGRVWLYRLWSAAADYLCTQVTRNLSLEEWRIYVGDSVPYERTCPALPSGRA